MKRLKKPKPRFLINMFTALKGSQFYFYLYHLLVTAQSIPIKLL